MREAQKGLLTSIELGMAVSDRLRQSEKQPKAPSTEQRDLQHPPENAVTEPTTAKTEHTADSAKKPKIDKAFPMFCTPEQEAHYRKLQECVLPFTEEELKQWQERWDSPEGIAERKRSEERMEQYKKPLTQEEWNKLLAPRLPKGWKSWDAQGREQHYQTPWHKDLIAYQNYIRSLSPLEVATLWETNQQRMRAGLPYLRTIEEVRLWQTLQRLMKDIAPSEETKQEEHEEKFSWLEWIANIASAMVDAMAAGASAEEAEEIAHNQYPEKAA